MADRPASPGPRVRLCITTNPYGFDPADLFGVAWRVNRRRSVLFVSRVLGKHIAVDPAVAQLAAVGLAAEVAAGLAGRPPGHPALPLADGLADPALAAHLVSAARRQPFGTGGPVLVIGYAETATALGHVVHDVLGDAAYVHTTRRVGPGQVSLLCFEEEHSHATTHHLAHRDRAFLANGHPVVLVDDELTTGRTALNTIAAIQRRFPRPRYVVASLLDWRDAGARARLAEAGTALGARIDTVALLGGEARGLDAVATAAAERPPAAAHPAGVRVHRHVLSGLPSPATARHGWDRADQDRLEAGLHRLGGQLAATRTSDEVLCLGTEELMYAPMRIAGAMGPGVRYQSTTRSPIVPLDVDGYPVRHKLAFDSPLEPGLASFLYNLAPRRYRELFLFVEGPLPGGRLASLVDALAATGLEHLHLVSLPGGGPPC